MAISIETLLEKALLEICKNKPLKKITVQDLLDETGVSRQTFYNYYRDKYDLINSTWLKLIIGVGQLDDNNSLYGYIFNALNRFVRHKDFIRQAEDLQGQDSLLDYMVEHNYSNYRTLYLRNHIREEITEELEYAMRFNAFGVSFSHMKWVKDGMKLSVEDMTRYEIDCLPEIMKDFLREDGILD